MNELRKQRPAISSDLGTKNFVVDSLAIGNTSFEISKKTDYPASTIRGFKRNNKGLIGRREKELDAMTPDIIADLQFKNKTSLELSMHKYRPDMFPNDTGYTDNQDIIAFQNNLSKTQHKVLEKQGILDSRINLLNTGRITINQQNVINPSVTRLVGTAAIKKLEDVECVENSEDDGAV